MRQEIFQAKYSAAYSHSAHSSSCIWQLDGITSICNFAHPAGRDKQCWLGRMYRDVIHCISMTLSCLHRAEATIRLASMWLNHGHHTLMLTLMSPLTSDLCHCRHHGSAEMLFAGQAFWTFHQLWGLICAAGVGSAWLFRTTLLRCHQSHTREAVAL